GQRVFLDLNDNGIWDPGEPGDVTDANGRYEFSGLALTRHRVRQDLSRARIAQTAPERNAAHEVELTEESSTAPDRDFGAKVLQAATSEVPSGEENSPQDQEPPSPRD